MSKNKKPPRWPEVYPQGTEEGNEEQKFFISLARDVSYCWRSVAAIAKESGLSEIRVESLLNKYRKLNMVFQNPKNDTMWGYWERVPDFLPKEVTSISNKDKNERIKKLMNP